jgi:NADH-quinone oxidoreductase subunit I
MSERESLKDVISRLFMLDLIKGLFVTLKYHNASLVQRRGKSGKGDDPLKGIYTKQYPKERPEVAERFRGAPRLNMDPETGETLCIACNLCALACPEDCIYVGSENREVTEGGKVKKKKVLTTYVFDTSRCMFCNLCAEACPTDCVELTQNFELASYTRAGAIWDREDLEGGRAIKNYLS